MTTGKHDSQPARILLVEDNPADAFLVQELLEEAVDRPFRIITAGSLAEALETAAGEPAPTLVLLDMGLPDCWGLETVRRFREARPDLRVIVLSGLDDTAVADQALGLGAEAFVVKGGDLDAVEQALTRDAA